MNQEQGRITHTCFVEAYAWVCDMIDTEQYRFKIGCFNSRILKARSRSNLNNYAYFSKGIKVEDACLCMLYLYFVVVVLCCSMSMSLNISYYIADISMDIPNANYLNIPSDLISMYYVKYL